METLKYLFKQLARYSPLIILGVIFAINSYYTSDIRAYQVKHTIAHFVEMKNTMLPMTTYLHRRITILNAFSKDYTEEAESHAVEYNQIKAKFGEVQGIIDMQNNARSGPEGFTLAIVTSIREIAPNYYGFDFLVSKCDAKAWHCEEPQIHIGTLKTQLGGVKTAINPLGLIILDYHDNCF
jgi:hypothetical protein